MPKTAQELVTASKELQGRLQKAAEELARLSSNADLHVGAQVEFENPGASETHLRNMTRSMTALRSEIEVARSVQTELASNIRNRSFIDKLCHMTSPTGVTPASQALDATLRKAAAIETAGGAKLAQAHRLYKQWQASQAPAPTDVPRPAVSTGAPVDGKPETLGYSEVVVDVDAVSDPGEGSSPVNHDHESDGDVNLSPIGVQTPPNQPPIGYGDVAPDASRVQAPSKNTPVGYGYVAPEQPHAPPPPRRAPVVNGYIDPDPAQLSPPSNLPPVAKGYVNPEDTRQSTPSEDETDDAMAPIVSDPTVGGPASEDDQIPAPQSKVSRAKIEAIKGTPAKAYPDPIRRDEGLGLLLDRRAQLQAELDDIRGTGKASPEARVVADGQAAVLLEAIAKLETDIEVRLSRQRVAVAPLGPEYKDEDKKTGGWRVKDGKRPERRQDESETDFDARMQAYRATEATRESDRVTTQYFDDAKRAAARLEVDPTTGNLRNAEGERASSDDGREYVMDPDGNLYQFATEIKSIGDDKEQRVHHSSVLAGKDVLGAGGLQIDGDGGITDISNLSGHYKPGRAQLIETVETLLRKGALLDSEWTDAEGRPLSGTAKKIYDGIQALRADLSDRLTDCTDEELTKFDGLVDEIGGRVASAESMLRKLGCAPSQRMSGATVSFGDVKRDMTGMDVKLMTVETTPVSEFLSTAGNGKKSPEARAKASMHDELRAKAFNPDSQAELEAEDRSALFQGRTKDPTDEEMQCMATELDEQGALLGTDETAPEMTLESALEAEAMPKEFVDMLVSLPGSAYAVHVGTEAKKLGVPAEDLWARLKSRK